jgi:hypothetical protein
MPNLRGRCRGQNMLVGSIPLSLTIVWGQGPLSREPVQFAHHAHAADRRSITVAKHSRLKSSDSRGTRHATPWSRNESLSSLRLHFASMLVHSYLTRMRIKVSPIFFSSSVVCLSFSRLLAGGCASGSRRFISAHESKSAGVNSFSTALRAVSSSRNLCTYSLYSS